MKERKEDRFTYDYYKATVDTRFTHVKRVVVAMLNEYKQLHNLGVFGPKYTTIMSHQENIKHSELLMF